MPVADRALSEVVVLRGVAAAEVRRALRAAGIETRDGIASRDKAGLLALPANEPIIGAIEGLAAKASFRLRSPRAETA